MKRTAIILAALALPLAACGGDGDDALGDRAEENYDAAADNLEDMADNAATPAQEDMLDQQADNLEAIGEQKEEAIDDSDVDADQLTEEQKNAMTSVQ
ncbi:hypothetical protein D1610_03530 [Sphingomonas gilva]|uniref:Secreted protein n=1 Tax=Sphingomonas gilva TaxID=2305907 RepID=A0A396RUX0_9SPHN|nr:hypothetical protein [Sphingomonas gilva]RHW19192.1 hypothetical protein D1610_03530 [Sphingomonas gilva]